MADIHWFPGHMKKAKIEIEEKVKIVDVVIELVDARAPISTRNKELLKITKQKPRLIIMSKKDLADPIVSNEWINYFMSEDSKVIFANLNDKSVIKEIENKVEELALNKREKEKRRGMKPQPIRAMIIGIPNVGKSTLINKLTKTTSAGVQNKPGFTKSQQWIRINKNFELLDTPGILPMKYDEQKTAIRLALLGSIRDEILPIEELASHLISTLNNNYPSYILNRYGFDSLNSESHIILQKIAISRGFYSSGEANIEQAAKTLLNEFKNGILGKASLERVDEYA